MLIKMSETLQTQVICAYKLCILTPREGCFEVAHIKQKIDI